MPEQKKLIQFKNIVKSFEDGQVVLKGVSLDIYENEFVTLLGPSGCGKTTLLRILGGFLQPTEGKVLFDGEDIVNVPPYKREINTVFQKYALFPHMNVYDNIAFGLTIKKEPKDVIAQKVMRMLRLVSLEDYADRNVTELSGGQQQRIAIARALVNEPSVLLLDEPLGALDLKLRKEMQQELKYIQQEVGITFIFVTHDQEEALTMSDKIVVMNAGEIQQIGTPTEIYRYPVNEFVANFIGETNIIDGVMQGDDLVVFEDKKFPCRARGFNKNEKVDVVIRPEHLDIVPRAEGMLKGVVKSQLFKGMHYDTVVETRVGTTITVKMQVSQDRPVLNADAGEKISASAFLRGAHLHQERRIRHQARGRQLLCHLHHRRRNVHHGQGRGHGGEPRGEQGLSGRDLRDELLQEGRGHSGEHRARHRSGNLGERVRVVPRGRRAGRDHRCQVRFRPRDHRAGRLRRDLLHRGL